MESGDNASFRVLALDGGGIKGTFCASLLATLEEMNPGVRLANHFDLICGTSTGGIIAIALGLGLTAGEILSFYLERGPEIFHATGVFDRSALWFWQAFVGPKYGQEALREALKDVFGDRAIGESSCRLVVPSYDATRGDIKLFKTAHDERLKQDYRCRAADVALATSAAPSYFCQATTERGDVHVDGGIWANSPITIGIHEAIAVLGQPRDRIRMLSIGATGAPFSVSVREGKRGAFWRGKRLVDLILNAQAAGAVAQGRLLLGEHFFRVDRAVEPGRFSLDDARRNGELRSLGDSVGRHAEAEIRRRFITPGPAPIFNPIYAVPVVN